VTHDDPKRWTNCRWEPGRDSGGLGNIKTTQNKNNKKEKEKGGVQEERITLCISFSLSVFESCVCSSSSGHFFFVSFSKAHCQASPRLSSLRGAPNTQARNPTQIILILVLFLFFFPPSPRAGHHSTYCGAVIMSGSN
jgi:hypothetical protein